MLQYNRRSRSFSGRRRRMEEGYPPILLSVKETDFRKPSDPPEKFTGVYQLVCDDNLPEHISCSDCDEDMSMKLTGKEAMSWILTDNKEECPSYIKLDSYVEEDLKHEGWVSLSKDVASTTSSPAVMKVNSSISLELFPFYSPQTIRRRELQDLLPKQNSIRIDVSRYLGPVFPSKQPRKDEWKQLLAKWTDPRSPPIEVKDLLRSGCPSSYRSHAWNLLIIRRTSVRRRITQYANAQTAGLEFANSKEGRTSSTVKQINDLMINTPDPALANQLRVRRVMLALQQTLKIDEFRYIHRLITAILPTLNDDEEGTFWAIIALHDSILPQQYFHRNSDVAEQDGKVLWTLLQTFAPDLFRALMNIPQRTGKLMLSSYTVLWRKTVLMGCFPQQLVWRLWDSMLLEGERMLFRYQVAILRTLQPLFQCLDSVEGVEKVLSMAGDLVHDVDAIAKIANDDLGSITGKFLSKIRRRIV